MRGCPCFRIWIFCVLRGIIKINYLKGMRDMEESKKNDLAYKAGMLSDKDINEFWGKGINVQVLGNENIEFDLKKQLRHGSIDLRFRHDYKKINLSKDEVLTYEMLKNHEYTSPYELKAGEKLRIEPGEMILTTTLETVNLSKEFAGIITGRSSIARLGIMVHCCQEFINPGHGQPIPLQIINLAPCPVELDLNVPICQLILFKLRSPAAQRYYDAADSKYSDEITAQNSKIYQETGNVESIKKEDSKIERKKTKQVLSNKVMPFLPSLIMTLFLTPIINACRDNKSLVDLIGEIQKLPVAVIILLVICIVLYVWLNRED